MCDDNRSSLSNIFGESYIDVVGVLCVAPGLLRAIRLLFCNGNRQEGDIVCDLRTTIPAPPFLCLFFLITRLSDVSQNTRVSFKGYKKCWTVLLLVVSFFYCCIINFHPLSGIKEQPLYYTQDSMDEEFGKGTLGVGCPCSMMHGWSSGKTPGLGVT